MCGKSDSHGESIASQISTVATCSCRQSGLDWSHLIDLASVDGAVGATEDGVRRPFPGGDLIPDGSRAATMAVTIDAPPRRYGRGLRSTKMAEDKEVTHGPVRPVPSAIWQVQQIG